MLPDKLVQWHRLIGTALRDMSTRSSLEVELEIDLSLRKQLLDIVIIKKGKGKLPKNMPDGFDNLAKYNLITYKSLHESLNSWALDEFLGYYTNYRKQSVPEGKTLPKENSFKLYAISTRFPKKLNSEFELIPQSEGLYQVCWGSRDMTIIVLNQIPQKEHNALWNAFSAEKERIAYGSKHYQIRSKDTSTILKQLLAKYRQEGIDMPYTTENFKHDVAMENLSALTIDERLQGLPTNEVIQRLSLDERLEGLSTNERLHGLSTNERFQGLSIEEIEASLEQLKSSSPDTNK